MEKILHINIQDSLDLGWYDYITLWELEEILIWYLSRIEYILSLLWERERLSHVYDIEVVQPISQYIVSVEETTKRVYDSFIK